MSSDSKIKKDRKKGAEHVFTGPLWGNKRSEAAEEVQSILEQILNQYSENPENFAVWLQPLLDEGLEIDQIYELILFGLVWPS